GTFKLPFIQLKQHILSGNHEFELPDGSIAIIPEEWFSRYSNIFDYTENRNGQLQVKKYHFGLLEDLFNEQEFEQEQKVEAFIAQEEVVLPEGLKAELRPYQKIGFQWLQYMHRNNFGACLADDMGLGKTLQILAFLQYQKEHVSKAIDTSEMPHQNTSLALPVQTPTPQLDLFGSVVQSKTDTKQKSEIHTACSLVIVPTSLIYNWQSEVKKFTNLSIHIHSGFNRLKQLDTIIEKCDLIISSYGTVRNDIELFTSYTFDTIILDESQAIKNPSSQTAISVNQLKSKYKIAMTGTPVENSITDLWSQINFLNPGILGNFNFFTRKYVTSIEKDKNEEDTIRLRNIVKPFIMRRTKEQVAQDLPDKTEKLVICEMSDEQKQTYERIKSEFRNELLSSISENGFRKSNMLILNGLIKLRQIANHPILADSGYLAGSGKFESIISSIHNVIDSGHKVLIFSQFVQHLSLLKQYLDSKSLPYLYIAGNIPSAERKQLVDRFQNKNEAMIFLISLKAGGTGLNLTAADYV
ncbi:MAG: DEAD/DEAH box helicase, partial [Bacteroidetes bacterium]|nr:DEAD/DEAH box helicase [Bacteroidota bacterium]